ncbi:glycosyltransferase family 87 protein [Taibaiella koreensis]|uniref:glycosyltransferase family 87 protein n=1 Tax=Taibaiella koreensis TaxID=1268548 RepID=UPI000E59985A|nr:glycosyltransferase family 87 protein [Taibaiella koreensis]
MNPVSKFKSLLQDNRTVIFLYLAITIVSCVQLILIDKNNNFYIFRSSSYHLLHGLPLYKAYPKEYFDFFYYNPVFPVLFLPFALLPLYTGLVVWLIAISLCCYFVFKKIPLASHKVNAFMLMLLFDLHNNLDHTQTNPFVLSFMLLVWILMEKEKLFWASFFIVLCFLIKGYGGIICLLCLYYRNWYKMIFYGLFWLIAFHILLLLFVTPHTALQYYSDWLQVISSDGIKESYSIYGVLNNLNEILPEKFILAGALLLLAAFMAMQFFIRQREKSHIVAFLLIWVIVFNRASESATYIIDIAGCAIWYLSRPANRFSTALFWITLLVATLIPTDISAAFDDFRYHYYLKCVLSLFILADIFIYTAGSLRRQNITVKPASL